MRSLALLLAGSCLWLLSGCGGERREAAPEETAAEREASVEDAFIHKVLGDEVAPATLRSLDAYFASLGEAIESTEASRMMDHLSIEEMVESLDQRGLVRFNVLTNRKDQFTFGFKQGMSQSLPEWKHTMGFDSHELRRVENLEDGRKLVYVRFWDDELEYYMKYRWWLLGSPGDGWKAYDWEDLDGNTRVSTLAGVMSSAAISNEPWIQSFLLMNQAFANALASENLSGMDAIERHYDDLMKSDGVPAEVESIARTVQSVVLQLRGDFEASLEQLDRIERLGGVSPLLHYQRGTSKFGMEKYDEAIGHYEDYAAELGWDADVHEMVSDAHRYLGHADEAVDHALRGLDDNNNSWGCLTSLALALPADRHDELRSRVEASENPEGAYASMIELAYYGDKIDIARNVFSLFESTHPDSPRLTDLRSLFD